MILIFMVGRRDGRKEVIFGGGSGGGSGQKVLVIFGREEFGKRRGERREEPMRGEEAMRGREGRKRWGI